MLFVYHPNKHIKIMPNIQYRPPHTRNKASASRTLGYSPSHQFILAQSYSYLTRTYHPTRPAACPGPHASMPAQPCIYFHVTIDATARNEPPAVQRHVLIWKLVLDSHLAVLGSHVIHVVTTIGRES